MGRTYRIGNDVMALRSELVSLNLTHNRSTEQDARIEEIRHELKIRRIIKEVGT
jgi:hypothetical protein